MEDHWRPNRINTEKTTSRHIIIKLLKTNDKEKNLKISQRNQNKNGGWLLIRNNAIQKTVEWHLYKVLKENLSVWILCSLKISFRNENEIKTVSDTQKMEEFIAIKPSLQEVLKAGRWEIYQIETQIYTKQLKAFKMSPLATVWNEPRKRR